MRLTITAFVAAVLVGWMTRGRLRHIARHTFRRWDALLLGLAAQLAIGWLSRPWSLVALLVSLGLLIAFSLFNRELIGFVLIAAGIGLNGAVIAVNDAMPVDGQALRAAGASSSDLRSVAGAKHRLARPDDRLLPLADVVPVPVLREVVSVGDLFVDLGLAVVVIAAMRPPSSRPSDQAPSGHHAE